MLIHTFGSHYANSSLVPLPISGVPLKILLLLLWLLYPVTIQVRCYGNITPLSQMYAGNSRTSHILFLQDITFFNVYKNILIYILTHLYIKKIKHTNNFVYV